MDETYATKPKHMPIEETEVFRRFEEASDSIWDAVMLWKPFERDTTGKQLVRAADSVAANLVEGDGRYSDGDAIHFFVIARASAREACHWLQLATRRKLIDHAAGAKLVLDLQVASKGLNKLISYRRSTKNANAVREQRSEYATDWPLETSGTADNESRNPTPNPAPTPDSQRLTPDPDGPTPNAQRQTPGAQHPHDFTEDR